MKQKARIYYSNTQKAQMWDRWQKGDSMCAIARLLIEAIHPKFRVSNYQLRSNQLVIDKLIARSSHTT